MRDIKFRAWSKDDNVMIYNLNSPSLQHGVLVPEDYILMQFTGLKDKNGKEIYEGDVIKSECDKVYWKSRKPTGEKNISVGYIKYLNENARYSMKLPNGDTQETSCIRQEIVSEWWEIIGNIYENPELLENRQ